MTAEIYLMQMGVNISYEIDDKLLLDVKGLPKTFSI